MLLLGLLPLTCLAQDDELLVQVSAPYIELHTGPGRGYPILQVAERGEWVSVLKRRTDWFKVRTERGREGWVKLEQMLQTRLADGSPLPIEIYSLESFQKRDWELGMQTGEMEGAAVLNVFGGFALSPSLTAELSASQALGNFSSLYMGDASLLLHPFPEWRYSPFFSLGGGMVHTSPSTTLVQAEDRLDFSAHVGLGVYAYLTRRFFVRGEYRRYTVFTGREENEVFNQWKLGLGVFF